MLIKRAVRILSAALRRDHREIHGDDKLGSDLNEKPRRGKLKRLKENCLETMAVSDAEDCSDPSAELPQEIRDAFFNGTKRRLTFRQAIISSKAIGRVLLRAMRDRWKIRRRKK